MVKTIQKARHLFEELKDITDMMLNAIRVNEMDIFESNMEIRSKLFVAYEALKPEMNEEDLRNIGADAFFKKLQLTDQVIQQELERYRKELGQSLTEVKIEISKASSGRKRVNQYQMMTNEVMSGNLFNTKK